MVFQLKVFLYLELFNKLLTLIQSFSFLRALQRASDILRESQVDRHKTVVYIADEQSTDGDPKAVADVLRDDGAMVFALGVGSHDYRSRELREIANPKSVGFLKNYENMNNHVVSEVLSNRVCGADRSKTKPLTGK